MFYVDEVPQGPSAAPENPEADTQLGLSKSTRQIRQVEKGVARRDMLLLKDKKTEVSGILPRPRDDTLNSSLAATAGVPFPPLSLGPADITLWNKCLCKGRGLVKAMALSDQEAGQQLYRPPRQSAQSPWQDPHALVKWTYDGYKPVEGALVDFYGGNNYPNHGYVRSQYPVQHVPGQLEVFPRRLKPRHARMLTFPAFTGDIS